MISQLLQLMINLSFERYQELIRTEMQYNDLLKFTQAGLYSTRLENCGHDGCFSYVIYNGKTKPFYRNCQNIEYHEGCGMTRCDKHLSDFGKDTDDMLVSFCEKCMSQ